MPFILKLRRNNALLEPQLTTKSHEHSKIPTLPDRYQLNQSKFKQPKCGQAPIKKHHANVCLKNKKRAEPLAKQSYDAKMTPVFYYAHIHICCSVSFRLSEALGSPVFTSFEKLFPAFYRQFLFLACIPPPPPPPPRAPAATQHHTPIHLTSQLQYHTPNITHPTSHTQRHTFNITHPISHTQHHTLNIQYHTPNITHPTSHTQHHTVNITHPTFNITHSTSRTQHHTLNIFFDLQARATGHRSRQDGRGK